MQFIQLFFKQIMSVERPSTARLLTSVDVWRTIAIQACLFVQYVPKCIARVDEL